MADGWDGGIDLDDYDEDNWLYIEEDFALADELAEGQIADPGFPGTNFEIGMESFDFQLFAYWNDIEYMDDEYWDDPMVHNNSGSWRARNGRGRKTSATHEKSRALDGGQQISGLNPLHKHRLMGSVDPLIFRSQEERSSLKDRVPLLSHNVSSYAFLPDWRKHFAQDRSANRIRQSSSMPPPSHTAQRLTEYPELPTTETGQKSLDDALNTLKNSNVGLDVLRNVIKGRLAMTELEGLDESVLLGVIAQAMSGSKFLDASVEALTQTLFADAGGDLGEADLPDEPTQRINAGGRNVSSGSDHEVYDEYASYENHAGISRTRGLDETRQSGNPALRMPTLSAMPSAPNGAVPHVLAASASDSDGKHRKRKISDRKDTETTHRSTEEPRKRRTLNAGNQPTKHSHTPESPQPGEGQ